MQVVQREISVGATTTIENVLQDLGLRVRTVPQSYGATDITLYATQSVTGLLISFFVGDRQPLEKSSIPIRTGVPVKPDDLVLSGVTARGGDQLQLQVDNPTAGAITLFFTIEVRELSAAERSQRRR